MDQSGIKFVFFIRTKNFRLGYVCIKVRLALISNLSNEEMIGKRQWWRRKKEEELRKEKEEELMRYMYMYSGGGIGTWVEFGAQTVANPDSDVGRVLRAVEGALTLRVTEEKMEELVYNAIDSATGPAHSGWSSRFENKKMY